jgi:hypothetical protein
MTQTTALSTRIAHLEALALPLLELRSALDVLNVQRDKVQANILEAERAQQQLDLIGLHVGAVLDGNPVTIEITGGADLPELHETSEPEEAETEASPEPVQEEEQAPDTVPETGDQSPEETHVEVAPQTASSRILEYLVAHPASTANEVAEGTGLLNNTVNAALSKLKGRGDVTADGWPSQYTLPAPNSVLVMVAVPESTPQADDVSPQLDRSRLPLDQRLLMEHLEKHGAMSQKLLCAQLNWVNSRADRAIGALLQGGLLGRRGGTLVAMPQELSGEATSEAE